jgi:hypothetical protein
LDQLYQVAIWLQEWLTNAASGDGLGAIDNSLNEGSEHHRKQQW